jgi:predicted transcriptional regulator of viral defense system
MPKATGASQQRISRVITTAGLRAAGLSAGQIGRLARDGTLQSLRTGVYAPTALVESVIRANGGGDLLQVAAALSVTGSRAVGSHHSAAAVHGLSLPGRLPPGRVELTRAPQDRGSRSRRPGILIHVADLPPDHVVAYRGVPFTSVARTVVDLARTLPFAEGVAVADSALRAEQTSKSELDAVIASCARWPGFATRPPSGGIQ